MTSFSSTAQKFIVLTDDASVFGSDFKGDFRAINDRIEAAAEKNGVAVIRSSNSTRNLEAAESEPGNEIDWFTRWTGRGYRYTAQQWDDFLKSA